MSLVGLSRSSPTAPSEFQGGRLDLDFRRRNPHIMRKRAMSLNSSPALTLTKARRSLPIIGTMETDDSGESLSSVFVIHMTLGEAVCVLRVSAPRQSSRRVRPGLQGNLEDDMGRPFPNAECRRARCKLRPYRRPSLLCIHITCEISIKIYFKDLLAMSSDNSETLLSLVLLAWS